MAFDATVGGASANSYDTDTNADAYFLDRGITTWTGTAADKQAALIRGTDYLERTYAGEWIGVKNTEAQALAWPRYDAVDLDGYTYENDEIPEPLKRATYEAALLVLTGTDLEPVQERGNSIKRERVKAGPVESETEYNSGAPTELTISSIDGLVKGLIQGTGSAVELLRV